MQLVTVQDGPGHAGERVRLGLSLTSAGATHATFVALVVVAAATVILVVPSFALLFALQGRRMLGGPAAPQGVRVDASRPKVWARFTASWWR